MSLEERFKAATEVPRTFSKMPANEDLLEIYGLFKQATVGDNNTDSPGMFDLKGKAKWQSWKDKKGMSKDAAMEAYIAKVEEMTPKYK